MLALEREALQQALPQQYRNPAPSGHHETVASTNGSVVANPPNIDNRKRAAGVARTSA